MKVDSKVKAISLRYGLLLPLSLMVASVVASVISYSDAKRSITDDLNEAMVALANENSELWTRQDTITALSKMHAATHKPIIYQAPELNLRNVALKDEVYFTMALTDRKSGAPKVEGNKIMSDSIMLLPAGGPEGMVVQVQGFADCSMASVFAVSDQSLPFFFLSLSLLSAGGMFLWNRKRSEEPDAELSAAEVLEGIKLTPMQRKFTQMLFNAPYRKVDKVTLCAALWDSKMNAEESLYTLVRRTKAALSETGFEIVCNRGESYELIVKH